MMSRIIFFMAAKVRIKEHNTKKKRFFLLLSSESTFGAVKGTKNLSVCANKIIYFLLTYLDFLYLCKNNSITSIENDYFCTESFRFGHRLHGLW